MNPDTISRVMVMPDKWWFTIGYFTFQFKVYYNRNSKNDFKCIWAFRDEGVLQGSRYITDELAEKWWNFLNHIASIEREVDYHECCMIIGQYEDHDGKEKQIMRGYFTGTSYGHPTYYLSLFEDEAVNSPDLEEIKELLDMRYVGCQVTQDEKVLQSFLEEFDREIYDNPKIQEWRLNALQEAKDSGSLANQLSAIYEIDPPDTPPFASRKMEYWEKLVDIIPEDQRENIHNEIAKALDEAIEKEETKLNN